MSLVYFVKFEQDISPIRIPAKHWIELRLLIEKFIEEGHGLPQWMIRE